MQLSAGLKNLDGFDSQKSIEGQDGYQDLDLNYPPVTEATLQGVVRRILAVASPLRIVLFGSRARGQANPGSDLHILIVEQSAPVRDKRAARYLSAMVGVYPAKGSELWTPEEVKAWASFHTRLHHHSPERGENASCQMNSPVGGRQAQPKI